MEIKCNSCEKVFERKSLGRFLDLVLSLEGDKCPKCVMERRTDLDRTGRSSKKDKYKNKSDREKDY